MIIFGLGLIAGGCATPQPLVRLHPDLNDVIWVNGRASIQNVSDGVRVAAAFERQEGDKVAMRVEVQNETAGRVEVEPQHITFSPCLAIPANTCLPSRAVIDPEQMLSTIDTTASRGAADAANQQVLLGTVAVVSVAADITAIGTGHASGATGLQTAAALNAMGDSASAAHAQQANLAAERWVWSDQALRRNTLFPGQTAGGLVYIPVDERARFVWLQAIIGGRTFSFHFAQTITPVAFPSQGKPASDQ